MFQDLGSRKVAADFSGGHLSSDGGVLLLQQADLSLGLTKQLAKCFCDGRDQRWTDHSVSQMLAQRIYGWALGYEDLNDHELLRLDPLLATACEKTDPLGQDRMLPQFRGVALAGASTLNRLELSNHKVSRAHKVTHDPSNVQNCLLQMGVKCISKKAREVVLDFDAMGSILHGQQEGRFFNGFYGNYCYLPLYVFCGNIPLWAQLRTSDRDAADGAVEALRQIIAALRQRCPGVRIIVRGDSGFARPALMDFCESQSKVYYCLGLHRNTRLEGLLAPAMAQMRGRQILCGGTAVRQFCELSYQTLETWKFKRRVVAKAEMTTDGGNPRFVVTNLPVEGFPEDQDSTRFCASRLYEEFYSARGQMENVLKQQVLDLKADRLSTHHLGSNQLRLWLSAMAYLLLERVRTLGLTGTELAQATVGSVRLKLLKVAAQITFSVRRVYIQLSSSWPYQEVFRQCARQLALCSRGPG